MNLHKSVIYMGIFSMIVPFSIPSIALETGVNTQPIKLTQNTNPTTYIKVQDFNSLVMQITEGEYKFRGILKRIGSKEFIGNDNQSRVVFNPYNGHVIVFNVATGTEFYNYYVAPVSGVGEDPDTICDPTTQTC